MFSLHKFANALPHPLWGLWLFALVFSCTSARDTAIFPQNTAAQAEPVLRRAKSDCQDWANYYPDPAHPEYMPKRYLRVNFHVMNSRDSTHNFREKEARVFLTQMLAVANARLDTNERNWRSPEGTATLPKNYRYVIAPQALKGDDGFYFHYHDEDCHFISSGRNQNNYDDKIFKKYGIGRDSIINIFLQVHPDDSIKSKTYRAVGQGIAFDNCFKIAGVYETKGRPDGYVGLMNHEMGHLVGLNHAWTFDGCPDTDDHPNRCWAYTSEPPCNAQATNNMMDYNAYQNALTPCQIGHVNALLSNEKSGMRQYLQRTWCVRNPAHDAVIRDSVLWAGARDLEGNLTIAAGGSLRIKCRLSMPENTQITVEPGGKLWLDGARLHNACGRRWKGIKIKTGKNGEKGLVFGENWVLENVPNRRH